MGWRNLSSWLKGGIIGLILNISFVSIDMIISVINNGNCSVICSPFGLVWLLGDLIWWGQGTNLALIISSSLSLIVIGALIGWVVGKIKSKSNKNKTGGKNE